MASFLPVSLVGNNLGQRHRHLNSLVHEAKESGASVQDVETLAEESTVDRLFKINLAIELKHVDYIIRNLKDEDMLYVSKALKAIWLIDHRDIINPQYLEGVLFPEMIAPAVTKMKHWLYINLRNPAMCQEFYQHYKENTFEFAIKFLSHCSHEFILEEGPKILTKLSPHSLKILCEKCPRVAKIYFDSFTTEEDVKTRYLGQDRSYYNSVKCVLKSDADVFLDITEKYFNMNSFSRFSPLTTDYILRCHKTRFTNKLELYVAYFLHIPTLASRLSVEECQEVVVRLARASYLQHWFQYKVVEPLIKRLNPNKRATFKKRVFVDKDIGDCEDKWPYEIPAPPVQSDLGQHIFDDQDFMCGISPVYPCRAPAGGAKRPAFACAMQPQAFFPNAQMNIIRVKTDLDKLFDEIRFIGFERALHELGQRLVVTASPDRRRDIFIALVSKTGGRTDAVAALLRLTARHINEPPHIRAAILRSLVKRAKVWRLPAEIWQHLLDFGHGLGLDGTNAEAACREGLHAVVIRQLLAGECEPAVRDAFMNDFSTLEEYSLKVDEKERVANGLQNMLAEAATHDEPAIAANRLWQLLDVLKIYHVRIESTSPAVRAVMTLASRNADVARRLLKRLYNERIARRELLRYNMEFRRDEAALLNALRHDPSVLEIKSVVDTMTVMDFSERKRIFTSRPKLFGRSASPRTGFTLGNSAVPSNSYSVGSTGIHFDSSATPVFRFGNSTSPKDVSSSGAPPTGYRFDSSAAPPASDSIAASQIDVASSTAPPTDGDSYAVPSTGFCFGGSAVPQTDVSSSNVLSTGISFSSAAQSIDNGSSDAPPIGFRFGSSVVPPIDGSSAAEPTGDGNSTADVSSSSFLPTGFHFGSPATPLTDFGSSAGYAVPSSDVGGSAAHPTEVGSSGNLPVVDSNAADPPMGFVSSTGYVVAPSDVDGSATLPTDVVSSANLATVDSNSADQSMGSGGSAPQPMNYGWSAPQPTGFGSTAPPPTGFGSTAPQLTSFGTSTSQSMHFGMAPQPCIGRNPYRPSRFRRFGARRANFDRFTSKLVIYYNQKQDFTTDLRTALKKKFAQELNFRLARSLASLLGNNFEEELRDFDAPGKRKFARVLRAYAHRARPVLNLVEWGWRKAGVKAVATRAMCCREKQRDALIRALAAEKRTVRVALALSIRSTSGLLVETFASTAKLRPAAALLTALLYFRRHGISSDPRVWDIVKPLISSINLEYHKKLRHLLGNTDWIPATIKPDYCITLYHVLFKISSNAQKLLRELSKLLPECDESIEHILLVMLDDDADHDIKAISYPAIFVRYLLLSENEEDVERRFMKIGNRFLECLRRESDYNFQRRLDQIMASLKYHAAFLNSKYTSCLSVIKRILDWTQTFMPKEEYFEKYVHINLTMLYFKAVRQSMEQMPEVFADPKRTKSEGVEAVGFVFGRYIVKEIAELVSTYFDSIIDLYADGLTKYLSCYLKRGTSRNIFIGFVLKGILTEAIGIQGLVAVYVLRDHQIVIKDSVRKEIEELIMKDRALQFFAHAELFSHDPVVPYHHNLRIHRRI